MPDQGLMLREVVIMHRHVAASYCRLLVEAAMQLGMPAAACCAMVFDVFVDGTSRIMVSDRPRCGRTGISLRKKHSANSGFSRPFSHWLLHDGHCWPVARSHEVLPWFPCG